MLLAIEEQMQILLYDGFRAREQTLEPGRDCHGRTPASGRFRLVYSKENNGPDHNIHKLIKG